MQQEMARLLSATTLADVARHDDVNLPCLPHSPCCCDATRTQPPK
jgi:hypothetical protein